jgi:hypothetical protein
VQKRAKIVVRFNLDLVLLFPLTSRKKEKKEEKRNPKKKQNRLVLGPIAVAKPL